MTHALGCGTPFLNILWSDASKLRIKSKNLYADISPHRGVNIRVTTLFHIYFTTDISISDSTLLQILQV
jgi:hypothetical protein